METPTLVQLTARMDRLEQENCWLRRLSVLSLAGLGVCLILVGVVRPRQELAAQRFVVQDSQGQTRAVLGLRANGQPGLMLLDTQGREQVALHTGDDHASWLEFRDQDRPRLTMTSSVGSATINLFDRHCLVGAGLFTRSDNSSGLVLNRRLDGLALLVDEQGQTRLARSDSKLGFPQTDAGSHDADQSAGAVSRDGLEPDEDRAERELGQPVAGPLEPSGRTPSSRAGLRLAPLRTEATAT